MPTRRETFLAAAFALWGLALAISLAALLDQPAPHDQIPGFAKSQNFDARGPFRFALALILLPIGAALLARPLSRRIARGETWAVNATIAASLLAIWFAVIARDPLWLIVPFGIAFGAFALLANRPLEFTRHDWILLPAFNTALIAVIDRSTMHVERAVVIALVIVLAVRIAVTFLRSPLPPALAFLVAPLGIVFQTSFFARDQRYMGWHALLLVIVTPFVMRAILRDRRRALAILAFVVYPLVVLAYPSATSMLPAEGKPRVNFFEDSHSIPIAGEYLRGAAPYRDQMPAHGLLEDGGFDYLVFQVREATVGSALHSRFIVGLLNAVAIYALGFAMTGSPEAGLVTYFFWQLTTSVFTIRATPALFTLVLIALAVRKRDSRYLLAAGLGAVLCGITSLDYALFTTIVLLAAVLRFRPRLPALKHAAIGIAAGVIPLFIGFAAFGILDDFVRTTFFDIPSLAGAYTLEIFATPEPIAEEPIFPELLAAWFDLDAFSHLTWCGIAIATAVLFTKARSRIREPFLLIGLWIVVAAISYAERHHLYFRVLLPAMLIPAAWYTIRRRVAWAPAVVIVLVIAALPTTHIGIVGMVRRQRGPETNEWREVHGVPRARGALFNDVEAKQLEAAKKYVDLALKPDETYFDFTNRAILFFLLRRENPVRFVEPAYYESEALQREVIAALEANPKVRAALVPPGGIVIDGVGSELRAPLVWNYLNQHFVPDFHEGQITFWRRKPKEVTSPR